MDLNSKTRLLIIAAHPDDELLGCGGTIVKALKYKAKVEVVFLGEGISARFPVGRYDSPEFKKFTQQRRKEAQQALKILGVKNVHFGTRLCVQFDTYPMISIVKEIEERMKAFRPTMLLTHNPSEVNIDHRITYEAVEAACRPTNPWVPRAIYTFEVICSGNWKFDPFFKPNVFVDIEKYWPKKAMAWRCYKGEQRPFPHFRSEKGLETLAIFRGLTVGISKAEAFRLVRRIV
ncbi:MAG: PIG-L family deacetylase [Candidatus Omnitrophota bacterium]|nr:PIG-L family deacetylase [Candidatus Omnitrophota bacterium]